MKQNANSDVSKYSLIVLDTQRGSQSALENLFPGHLSFDRVTQGPLVSPHYP